ncbi:hypothetical protein VDGE_00550 [Verticillium dahliae]|uniref:COP9 signalosome complex subunit 6 n=1 Tax=Verticillium dahliae TaxID=27337 RepID=A0A444S8Y3_VERDA|nr:hypothetical protein VDGE_00550 [Verticillium dahliae]
MSSNAGLKSVNPLISNQSSELQAVLHPLVLLSISDYITRHTLREHEWPMIGGLMGQHNGREVTIEHAFDCHVAPSPDTPYKYGLDLPRVLGRIEQMRAVHKDRSLDFVGWYTLLPKTGPTQELTHIHNTILNHINESAILLGFHPKEVLDHSVGGKLPLTVYESNYEVDDAAKAADTEGDKTMEDGESTLKLRFRELGYTVETGEAEMISMDFVARGSGTATAVEPPKEKQKGKDANTASGKGKQKADSLLPVEDDAALTPEEEEMIAALTAKANATKMLLSRIHLIMTYLERLPAAYVSGKEMSAQPAGDHETTPSNTILRQIHALVGRLDLVEPSDVEAFRREVVCEQNDVHLVSLLNDVMQSVQEVRSMGRKFDVVDSAKARDQRNRTPWEMPTGRPSPYGIQGAGDIMF